MKFKKSFLKTIITLTLIILSFILKACILPPFTLPANVNISSLLLRPSSYIKVDNQKFLISNVRCDIKLELDSRNSFKLIKDNILWDTLSVNIEKVEDVYLIIEPLTPYIFASHLAIWFEFLKDYPLIGKTTGFKTYGLVVSGQKFENGNKRNFLFQISSKEDYFKMAYLFKRDLWLFKLNLNNKQKRDLLYNFIVAAHNKALNEKFHMSNNNCLTNFYTVLNTVLPEYQKLNFWLIDKYAINPLYVVPKFNVFIFNLYNLISERLPDFKGSL